MKDAIKFIATTVLAKYRSHLQGEYSTYGDARRAAGNSDYEASAITEIVRLKTEAMRSRIASGGAVDQYDEVTSLLLLAIMRVACARPTVRVLDFGGACGAHFLLARALAPREVELRWAVVETSAMVDAARDGISSDIHFFAAIEEAATALGAVDVVFANNSLQYTADPAFCLDQLVGLDSESLCICKVPTGATPRVFFTVQTSRIADNGPGAPPAGVSDRKVRYPMAVLPSAEVDRRIEKRYRPLARYDHPAMLYHRSIGLIRYSSVLAARS